MENDVVVEQEIVLCTGNGGVPLAGKVGILRVALTVVGEEVLQLGGVRPRVDDLVGINAGNGVAGDVAGVVEAGLDRAEAGFLQPLEDFRQIAQQHTAQLQVLTGGDVAAAVVAVALNDGANHPQLIGRQHTIGHPQAQHEFAWRFRTPEHAVPLQTQLEVGFIHLLPAELGEFFNFAADQQAIFGRLVLLDLVELLAIQVSPGGRANGHKSNNDWAD